jgi:hypothetical protein
VPDCQGNGGQSAPATKAVLFSKTNREYWIRAVRVFKCALKPVPQSNNPVQRWGMMAREWLTGRGLWCLLLYQFDKGLCDEVLCPYRQNSVEIVGGLYSEIALRKNWETCHSVY